MAKKTKTKKVPETVQVTEAPVKTKERRAVYVFCALLLTVLPLAVLCLLDMKVLLASGSSFVVYGEESYLGLIMSYFKNGSWAKIYEAAGLAAVEADLFGFGLIAGGELFGKIYGIAFYAIAIAVAFTVLLCLFSLIIPKAARSLSKLIAFIDFFVFLLTFLLTFVLTAGSEGAPVIDIVTLAVVADTILLYLITAGARKTGKTVLSFICLLFSLAALGGVAYTMYQKASIYFLGEEMLDKVFVLGALGATLFASIYNITFNLFLWSLGVMICTKDRDLDKDGVDDHAEAKAEGASITKALLHPVTIAAAIGLLFFVFPIKDYIPEVIWGLVSDTATHLKNLVAPLSMIVIGLRLPDIKFKGMEKDKYMYLFLALRHVILPLAVVGVLKLVALTGLTIHPAVAPVVLILASAPAASSATMFAEKYDCDATYVSRLVTVSTLLSIVTMPLLLMLI